MNDSPSFSSILDRAATDIEPPKQLPVGHYVCIIKGQPLFDKSSKKQTDFVRFFLLPIQAMDDVDTDSLAEIGGLGEKQLRLDFYLTDDAAYRLKDFLQDDLDIDLEGITLRLGINEAIGKSVIAEVGHRAGTDGKRFYAEIKSTSRYGD